MPFYDFAKHFSSIDVCDRNTKHDLVLNLHEELPVLGPLWGCATGCCKFWCQCRGLRTIYCGRHSSDRIMKKDPCPCCSSVMGLCPGDSV